MQAVTTLMIMTTIMAQATWNDPHYLDIVDLVNNNPKSTWKAKLSSGIPYGDKAALKSMLGAIAHPGKQPPKNNDPSGRRLQADSNPPKTYNLIQAFPLCKSIGKIRNQGQCGSCWSVAGANVITDAFCIQHAIKNPLAVRNRRFSYQDPLENCTKDICGTTPKTINGVLTSGGCDGGWIDGALEFGKVHGIVTGETFMEKWLCKPYISSPISPKADTTCKNVPPTNYIKNKWKIHGYTWIQASSGKTVEWVARDAVVKLGPLIVGFQVYEDFYAYKSGVYVKREPTPQVSNNFEGWHAVRLIGWGEQPSSDPLKPTLFWLCANSWGTGWGDKGFFKILRGSNHVGIENWMYSVTAIAP